MKRLVTISCLAAFMLSACAIGSGAGAGAGAGTSAAPADNQVVTVQAEVPKPAFKAGRFALQVDSQPPQSFILSFDLTGGLPDGTLNIYNPLGLQMARLEWTQPVPNSFRAVRWAMPQTLKVWCTNSQAHPCPPLL